MATEVVAGKYLFLPPVEAEDLGDSEAEGGLVQDDWTTGQDGKQGAGSRYDDYDTPKPPKRIFVHNHLHDYESVWWVAVWFICRWKPGDEDMERVRYEVYKDRRETFVFGEIEEALELLPPVLQPLGKILVRMRNILVCAYQSF